MNTPSSITNTVATQHPQILLRVCGIAAEQMGMDPAQVFAASHLVNDLNMDSLDRVEFAMQLEEEFDLNIPDDVAENVQRIGDVVEAIAAQQAPPAKAD